MFAYTNEKLGCTLKAYRKRNLTMHTNDRVHMTYAMVAYINKKSNCTQHAYRKIILLLEHTGLILHVPYPPGVKLAYIQKLNSTTHSTCALRNPGANCALSGSLKRKYLKNKMTLPPSLKWFKAKETTLITKLSIYLFFRHKVTSSSYHLCSIIRQTVKQLLQLIT